MKSFKLLKIFIVLILPLNSCNEIEVAGTWATETENHSFHAVDYDDNIYEAFDFYGLHTVGEVQFTGNPYGLLLLKYSPDGQLLWAKQLMSGDFVLNGISCDGAGVFLFGNAVREYEVGSISIPRLDEFGEFTWDQGFILKTNLEGDRQWLQRTYGFVPDQCYAEKSQGLYVTGRAGISYGGPKMIKHALQMNATVAEVAANATDHDPQVAIDRDEVVVARYNKEDGSLIWYKTSTHIEPITDFHSRAVVFDAPGQHLKGPSIAAAFDGSCVLTGVLQGQVNFDNLEVGSIGSGPNEGKFFVVKFNADGSTAWAMNSDGLRGSTCIDIDKRGGILIGAFGRLPAMIGHPARGYVSLDGTNERAVLLAIEPDGSLAWNKLFPSPESGDYGNINSGLEFSSITSAGYRIVVCGSGKDQMAFDALHNLNGAVGWQGFVAVYRENGDVLDVKKLYSTGGARIEQLVSQYHTSSSVVYGYYFGEFLDESISLPPSNNMENFLMKITWLEQTAGGQ